MRHRGSTRAAAVGMLAVAGTTACFASKSDVDQLRDEVNNVRAESLATDSVRAMQMAQILSTLRSVNDTLAALGVRLTRVRAESQAGMRDLHEQLMQVQEATGQSQQRLQEMRAAIDQRNRATVPPVAPPAGSPAETTSVAQRASDVPTANELFQLGRDQLAHGGNSAARAAFADLLSRYPDSELAPDAQFYLAEALAATGKTAAADSAYATVLTKYPTSHRAPTALYKRGVSQQKAGRTTAAKRTFNEVIRLFPDSDEAALARERLRAMS